MEATLERLALPEVEGEIDAEPHYAPLPREVQEPERDTAWETLCDAGREAADNMDEGRWIIGDLALLVRKQYGRDKIGEFAKQIGVKKTRVQEYRTVCKYFPKDERDLFRAEHPPMTYTHFRAAKRLKDLKASYALLEQATSEKEPWTAEEIEYKVSRKLHPDDDDPPAPIIREKLCHIKDGGEERYILFEFPDKETWAIVMAALAQGKGNNLLMTLIPEGE